MTAKSAGRSTRRWKKLRAQYRTQCESRNEPCHLCGQEIDYSLKYPDPSSWTLDHFYPVSTHPQFAEDPGNCRASHARCNLSRQNKKLQGNLGTRSRDW